MGQAPIAQNPLGKVPVLVTDTGAALFDSRVICRYLDDKAQAGLYGSETRLWMNLTLEAMADGIMEAVILTVYEARLRPEALYFSDWVEGQLQKVERALDRLENTHIGDLGGDLSAAQITIGAALGYCDLRMAERTWRKSRPVLADWYEDFSARPAMQKTNPAQI